MMDNRFSRRHLFLRTARRSRSAQGVWKYPLAFEFGIQVRERETQHCAIGTGLRGNQILIGALSPTTLSRCAM